MSVKGWNGIKARFTSTNSRGDTIIEVMLSIAVVGLVIGISYSIANKSIKTGRAAQEQTEALQLAQQQLEQVKVLAADKTKWTSVSSLAPASYCITPAQAVVASSNALCKNRGSGGLYNLSVTYNAPSNDTFTITTSWTNVNNQPSTVSIAYRMHAP